MYNRYYHIFRDYDIRGVFNKDLTPDVVARIGMAIASYSPNTYAIGGDTRSSTPIIIKALESGLLSSGLDVYEVGIGPIGMSLYSTLHKGYGMAYVTASHLPPEWNGIKLSRPNGDPMVGKDIYTIRDIFMCDEKIRKVGYNEVGRLYITPLLEEYKDFLRSRGGNGELRIVVDCGNGAASLVVPNILRDLGYEVISLNCDVDHRFPARGSEPRSDRISLLSNTVREVKADFGVAFDGDGDRTLFVDEKGRPLSAEQAAIVMLEGMGKGNVVANVECSMVLSEYVNSYGGEVYRVPVGRTYMIREIVKTDAILGVESSGHYVVWRNLNMDDGILTLIYFSKAVSRLSGSISEVVPSMYPIERINLEVDDRIKFDIVKRVGKILEKEFGYVDMTDGIRVNLEKGWVLIRPSNTEPLIRITIEARDAEALKRIKGTFLRIVKEEIDKAKEVIK